MIPLVAVIRVDRLRLWIPLFIVWLLLLPLVLLLLPLLMLVGLAVGINPFRALAAFWHVFSGLRGTNIEVNDANAAVRVRIF
jgi:hypothetical protein